MKSHRIPSFILATLAAGILCQPASAQESSPGSVVHGVLFLPLDFYPDHREALGLSEDQVREMHRLAGSMREPAEKIEAEMRERTQALHEAVGRTPFEPEKVMERFEKVLQAENEMKMLQFRTRIAMRSLLTPDQYAKVEGLAKKEIAARGGEPSAEMHGMLQRVREQLRKRADGGEVPREMVERLERIEQMAKQGRVGEAREQIEAMLRHQRDERGERGSAEGRRPDGARQPVEIEQRMRKVAEELERTTDPAKREQFQQELRKMREQQEHSRGGAERKRPEGTPQAEREETEKRMRRIAEAAERTDNPELRERLQVAARRLREAAESGNRAVAEDIMRSIEPVLREAAPDRERPKRD